MIHVGIGLPTAAAASRPDIVAEWVTRAEAGPFSSVAVTDRVVGQALEPLAMLAAAAVLTRRVRLLASVIIGPTRETTLLARQAASIDALSGGRLTLGLGVGAREDDYRASGCDFRTRGRRLDGQLESLRRIWSGESIAEDGGSIGPLPARSGGPELLIGGYVDAVSRRIIDWGDGYMAPGGGDPGHIEALWGRVRSGWIEAGRAGSPRFAGGSYFALGPGADDAARDYVMAAYGHDRALAERRLRGVPTTAEGVRATIERWAGLGADEVILRPCAPDPEQIDAVAAIVSGPPAWTVPRLLRARAR